MRKNKRFILSVVLIPVEIEYVIFGVIDGICVVLFEDTSREGKRRPTKWTETIRSLRKPEAACVETDNC